MLRPLRGWHVTGNGASERSQQVVNQIDVDSSSATALKKFVRVMRAREDGYVEFQFAISEQALYVELILPCEAFDEFCKTNNVVTLAGAQQDVEH